MAIRVPLSSCSVALLGLLLCGEMIGCVAAPTSERLAAPPAYRAPSEIKPSSESIKPAPMASAPAFEPAATRPPPVASTAAWVPHVKARQWRYIVIHHSATSSGNAAKFDREHKAKGWDELGYHFVIDNGIGGPDGRVEVGPRWPKQKWGAHAKTPDNRYNELGIGICFVGNFESGRPTARQLQSAAKLIAYLMQTYNIPASNVIGHDDTKSTLCPGRNLNLAQVRRLANDVIAGAPLELPEQAPASAGLATQTDRELLIAR